MSTETSDKRFKITYCTSCGYRDKAAKLAEELEGALKEQCTITPADGGVFEVEDKGVKIFSKNELGRFPEEGEVLTIVRSVSEGLSLEEAKAKAAPQSHGILDWIYGFFKGTSES